MMNDNGPIESKIKVDDDDDDLHCAICLDFLYEPLTLQCHHSFCRVCLLQSTKQAPDGRSCPQCRATITNIKDPINHPTDAVITAKIVAIANSNSSSSNSNSISINRIQERKVESTQLLELLKKQSEEMIPVFIMRGCNSSGPGSRVNLHFFEPRYKVLIRRAWEGNRKFLWVERTPANSGRSTTGRMPINGLLVHVETARFLTDGRANIVGRGVERITYPHCWIENGTQGLWYASNNNTNNNSSNSTVNGRSSSQQGGAAVATTISTQINNNYGDREFPIFSYNGLSLNTNGTNTNMNTNTSSFTLFEPRYIIMANECWGRGRGNNNNNNNRNENDNTNTNDSSNEKLLLCVSTAIPRTGQVAVLARMESCTDLTTTTATTTTPRKQISLIGLRSHVILRSVREDSEKEGLWYAQINTAAAAATTTEISSRGNNNCNCIIS
mmetsp:Transcript_36293/g.40409  ORF Transcript_36293/g.40409 Transcript_36293/m.40409 type:complete len:442 (-) Transcript_36293:66-1391(-)